MEASMKFVGDTDIPVLILDDGTEIPWLREWMKDMFEQSVLLNEFPAYFREIIEPTLNEQQKKACTNDVVREIPVAFFKYCLAMAKNSPGEI
jgi:c-di-AMP phosphodiesterase-like protein